MKKIKLLLVAVLIGITLKAQTWSSVNSGSYSGTLILTLGSYSSELYAGGTFTTIGGLASSNIAKWNGSAWSPLGTGANAQVKCMLVYAGELYVGGDFTSINGVSANYLIKYNGTTWSTVGSSTALNGSVNALAIHGGALYVGGGFTNVNGATSTGIAKWSGSAWSTIGAGVSGGSVPQVFALASYGTDLYIGGSFTSCNGVTSTMNIAKWNGVACSSIGNMTGPGGASGGTVRALTVFGTDLIAGGGFYLAGGVSVGYIAKWNGTIWSTVGTVGVGGTAPVFVYTLAVSNFKLYAGGNFTSVNGATTPANYVAQWDGAVWSAMSTGMSNGVNPTRVWALVDHNSELYAGGDFTTAGSLSAVDVAKWSSPTTNIDENESLSLRVFPNPAQDIVYIENSVGIIEIFDYNGRLVLSTREYAINTSNLSNGLYIVKSNNTYTKFIKN